ncbi:universal stress protein [Streptomyces atratus]|uniref:universal stress protein n=1 Tax=Streptomyces atratus TaxID=1893 RepID=UPI000D1BFD6A
MGDNGDKGSGDCGEAHRRLGALPGDLQERRRRSHSIGSPLGRVTHAVLHHAHCPVLLVPHPR